MRPVWLVAAVILAAVATHQRRRLGRGAVALAAVAAVAAALYGLGVYDLPKFDELLLDVGDTLGTWTYALVGVLAFLEAAVFLGLAIPGETGVLIGGVIAGQGQIQLGWLIATAVTCAYVGDLTGYWFGRRLGREWLTAYGRRFGLRDRHVERVDAFFARHGGKAVVFGRYVAVVRSLSPFMAGAARMPFRSFAFWDLIGASTQSASFCVIGYVFWRSIDEVLDVVESGALVLTAIAGLVVLSIFLVRRLRRG